MQLMKYFLSVDLAVLIILLATYLGGDLSSSKGDRDAVLDKTKALKTSGKEYEKIYVKKDTHPSIRVEWRRLFDAQKTEKERPENIGCNILYRHEGT